MNRLLVLLFVMVNLIDLKLTDHFLKNTCIQEQNPIASVIYEHSGLVGLFILKLFSIVVLLLSCTIIAKNKPYLAHKVAVVGTGLVSIGVIYTMYALMSIKNIVLE